MVTTHAALAGGSRDRTAPCRPPSRAPMARQRRPRHGLARALRRGLENKQAQVLLAATALAMTLEKPANAALSSSA